MPPPGCAVCGLTTNLICKDCKSASYCSSNCQTKDKPLHDLLCVGFSDTLDRNPRPQHYLALLLRNDEGKIQRTFIWVKPLGQSSKIKACPPALRDWLGPGTQKGLSHTSFDRTIQIATVEDNGDDVGVDELIERTKNFTMRSEPSPTHVRGSMVVMGLEKESTINADSCGFVYRDFTLDDFRVFSDFVLQDSYIFDTHEDEDPCPFIIFEQPNWLKAVKIANQGEIQKHGSDPFRPVFINKNHPKFAKYDEKSAITARMGIPLLFRRCPFQVGSSPRDNFAPNVNPAGFFMLLGINTSDMDELWGRVDFPKYDNEQDPTFLVFREDGEDITAHQVEALSDYCQNVMHEELRDEDCVWDMQKKEDVLDLWCSAQKFGEFFRAFKRDKIKNGDASWADATIPKGMRRHTMRGDRPSKRKRDVSPGSMEPLEGVHESGMAGDNVDTGIDQEKAV